MRIPPVPLLLCTLVGAACSDLELQLPLPSEEASGSTLSAPPLMSTPPATPTLPSSPRFGSGVDSGVVFPSPRRRTRRDATSTAAPLSPSDTSLSTTAGTDSTTISTTAEIATTGTTAIVTTTAEASSTTTTTTVNATIPSPPATAPTSLPFATPIPLDMSISPSLTSNCMSYLTTLLTTPLFISCLPFSLLLTTSTAYASLLSTAISSANFTDLNILLSYVSSPLPGTTACQTYMDSLLGGSTSSTSSGTLGGKGQCGVDLDKTPVNAVAEETRVGLGTYKVMRETAGLVSLDSGRYCYLEAVAAEQPDDLYLWSLPAGIPLPPSTTPTCSTCSSQLLNLYMLNLVSNSTMNATIISNAVGTVTTQCGSAFVTYQAAAVSSGSKRVSALPLPLPVPFTLPVSLLVSVWGSHSAWAVGWVVGTVATLVLTALAF